MHSRESNFQVKRVEANKIQVVAYGNSKENTPSCGRKIILPENDFLAKSITICTISYFPWKCESMSSTFFHNSYFEYTFLGKPGF